MDTLKELRNLDRDDILAALGLQTRRNVAEQVLPLLGLFSAGILVGVGVGMLMSPKAGRELREDLSRRVSDVRDRAMSSARQAADEVNQSH